MAHDDSAIIGDSVRPLHFIRFVAAIRMDSPLPGSAAPMPDHATASIAAGWQRLPARARYTFMLAGGLAGLPAALLGRLLDASLRLPGHWLWMAAGAIAGAAVGAASGRLRHRHLRWRLNTDSLGLRRGRLWRTELLVPVNRVQHLDLRRGPLDRRFGLASLVVHTAGSRHTAIALNGLALDDAQRLRDALAQHAHLDREPDQAFAPADIASDDER